MFAPRKPQLYRNIRHAASSQEKPPHITYHVDLIITGAKITR